jgi:hypothetical protein
MRKRFIGIVLGAALSASFVASAKEIAGVTLPDTLMIGSTALKLNGAGLRKKAMFKVYVGGLYLETPSKDAAAILASNKSKAVRMHFLRDLSKEQLTDAFKEGFEANAKEKATAQQGNVDKFLGWVTDVKEGEELTFSYAPGTGTTVLKGDQPIGVIAGKDFADALYAVWLGPVPPTEDLKNGMLGL